MQLIPAIDLHHGKCVRLKKGVLDTAVVYGDDPATVAEHWIECGARRLHVVDLDGATAGRTSNLDAVQAILEVTGDVPVQLGGGIRKEEDVRLWLDRGIAQVVVGTFALEQRYRFQTLANEHPRKLALALDIRNESVLTHGWNRVADATLDETIMEYLAVPLFAIVCTDVERDGMQNGVNLDATLRVLASSDVSVIASGGVRDERDVEALAQIAVNQPHLMGVICGTALYEGSIDFRRTSAILASQVAS
ncbi:MAG: 1-(5-phosphoribosyl)-5-[(5-phosphoribosylamino)methylideneamino]imidazole-4-carboxamide isomerase [Gammaproteobacteria bacterium]|nr:1-(5-phosphoribosyl)-5-[(5-phosphoribosylamino)methylideneamino]imidazole-4-carboxamide isomerase [Gammaproteobacteria bacterium]